MRSPCPFEGFFCPYSHSLISKSSPHYRHITLNTWATLNEDTIAHRYFSVSFRNIQAAFAHFLRVYNQGRPFILANFSQGGKSVVELLKRLTPAERQRLVAAYVLRYKVTPTMSNKLHGYVPPKIPPTQESPSATTPFVRSLHQTHCKRSQCHVYQSSQLAHRLHPCASSRHPHRHARPNSPSTCSPRLR